MLLLKPLSKFFFISLTNKIGDFHLCGLNVQLEIIKKSFMGNWNRKMEPGTCNDCFSRISGYTGTRISGGLAIHSPESNKSSRWSLIDLVHMATCSIRWAILWSTESNKSSRWSLIDLVHMATCSNSLGYTVEY